MGIRRCLEEIAEVSTDTRATRSITAALPRATAVTETRGVSTPNCSTCSAGMVVGISGAQMGPGTTTFARIPPPRARAIAAARPILCPHR